MYVQIIKIIMIFNTEHASESIGIEVEYNVILDSDMPNRTLVTNPKEGSLSVVNIANDTLTGKAVILNDADFNVNECTMWGLSRHIHEKIMKSII